MYVPITKVTRIDARPTDAALVIASQTGDQNAFKALFLRHVRLAAGLGYRLLGTDDEVDDIVQESFAQALANIGALQDPQAFASWLASIVTAQALRTIRRKRLLRRLGLVRGSGASPEALRISPMPPVFRSLRPMSTA